MHERRGYGESAEMYLKSIHELSEDGGVVPISRLAERLEISVVSATEMVHRMQEQGLIEHRPYKGVLLTPGGEQTALSILRRQRLWECFLEQHLGLPWDLVYEQACQLEHAVGGEVTEALAEFLGQPERCPHGNPIPTADGRITPVEGIPLGALEAGEAATILRIDPLGSQSLAYLAEHGLVPWAEIRVAELEPLDGLRTLETAQGTAVVGKQIAERIYVAPTTGNARAG